MTESKEARIDGGPVHYLQHDGNGSPVVLVHGLGGSHANWHGVAEELAKKHRVFVIDLPGFGRTRLHGRSSDVESNARVLRHFIDDVVGEPVTLIGNSMGGFLSLLVAADAPSKVRSVVLVNAAIPRAIGAPIDRQVGIVFSLYMIPKVGELVMSRLQSKQTPAQFAKQAMKLCAADYRALDPAILAAHVALAEERYAGADPATVREHQTSFLVAARSLLKALWNRERGRGARAIDAIRAPVLVLQGDRDRLVNVASARAVAARRNWELEVFEGIGHVPQLEIPARFVDTVERWLARTHCASVESASASAPA